MAEMMYSVVQVTHYIKVAPVTLSMCLGSLLLLHPALECFEHEGGAVGRSELAELK